MNTCYVLCGIPASGKTTLAHQLAEQHNAIVHSYDDLPNSWGNLDKDDSFFVQWIDNIKADLSNGNSVVCDSTTLTSEVRRRIVDEVSAFDCEKVLIVMVTPVETCIARNKGRYREVPENQIRLSACLIQAPTDDEGWDEIYVCED